MLSRNHPPQRIAVIGSGISGNVAARLLSARHEVHLFEASDHLGGHTHTVEFERFGRRYVVDTGFMVFNDRTYPNFVRLLDLLGVPSRRSDMSFSVRCGRRGTEYQGSSLNGLYAHRRNLWRPRFHRMLVDVLRFNRDASLLAVRGDAGETLAQFVDRRGYGRWFVELYLRPMIAAIWSACPRRVDEFPALFLARFFANHGLLQLRDRPQWRTVLGGAANYVSKLLEPLRDRIHLSTPIASISRGDSHVVVEPAGLAPQVFDQVVLATHPDQALRLLNDATVLERQILGAFAYQSNQAILHTDARVLPRRRRAWASWNYSVPRERDANVSVTYNLNRLQGHTSPEPICVTLNPWQHIDSRKIIRDISFRHPVFDRRSLDAQKRRDEISGKQRTFFCGAYWGNGFHEDGVQSALAVAAHFDLGIEDCTVVSTAGTSAISVSSP